MTLLRDFFAFFGPLAFVLFFASPSFATLGKPESSIENDRKHFKMNRKSASPQANYTIHTLEADGTTVREYVSMNGVVFGIAWNGLTHPDLTPLLGGYNPKYKELSIKNPRLQGKRSHQMKSDTLVVERWGHMRNLQGHAFDPSLIPAGVNPNEIK